jgi:hypothetical protein
MSDRLLWEDEFVNVNVPSAIPSTDLSRIQISVAIVKTNFESIVSALQPYSSKMGDARPGRLTKSSAHLELTINDNSMLQLRFFFKCPVCNGVNGTTNLPIESFSYKHKCFVAHCLLCKTKIKVAVSESWCSGCEDRIECLLSPISKVESGETDGNQEYPSAI